MYRSFFALKGKPFLLLSDREFLYLGEQHKTALSLLEYGILSQAGFIVITGDPGTGKTTLLREILAEYRQNFSVGTIVNTHGDLEGLLPWILLAFGIGKKGQDPREAFQSFTEFIATESAKNKRVILIVDEAQNLGVQLLEELRLLSNLNEDKNQSLQIILAGQPDLRMLLQRPDMTQFAQRVTVDYHLTPFNEQETCRYIRHRLQIAGGHGSLFTDHACLLVYQLTRGNPRLINQVCETALIHGFSHQQSPITAKLIAEAAETRTSGGILPLETSPDQEALIQQEALVPPKGYSAPSSPFTDPTSRELGQPQGQDDPLELFSRGMAMRRGNRYEEAISIFEKAAHMKTCEFKAYGQIGYCYRQMGKLNDAVLAFRKALTYQPESTNEKLKIRYQLGRVFEALGRTHDAIECYRHVLLVDPEYVDVATRIKTLSKKNKISIKTKGRPTNTSWLGGALERMQQKLRASQ